MILDHFIMTIIAMLFVIPVMITDLINIINANNDQPNFDFFNNPLSNLAILGFALYFCKDCIDGRSIAKRILKLQVVDNTTGQPARPVKCLIRNLFIIIWPVEAVVALINPERRLGDRVAGTRLTRFIPTTERRRANTGETLIVLFITCGLLYLGMNSLKNWVLNREDTEIHYIESSFNQAESQALMQILADSLGQYCTPEVRLYDKTQNTRLRYIAVILRLKENYLANDDTYMQLNTLVTDLIYKKYPKESFAGRLKYIFESSYKIESKSVYFGKETKAQQAE